MRRLTKRKMSRTYLLQDGCSLCAYDERCHSIFCQNYDCVRIKDRSCPYLHVIDRLAAYEDTGMEPKEALSAKELAEAVCYMKKDLVAVISAIKMLKEYLAIGPITHLRSLVQAEQHGRLVVLPTDGNCDNCPLCCGDCGSCHIIGYPPDPHKCRSVIREKAEVALEGDGE